jgi:hypothetical protein
MHSFILPSNPLPTETTVYFKTIKEIELYVASHSFLPDKFSGWQMGITDDPAVLRLEQREKGALQYWQVWEVTNRVAWSLQNYFRGRSMQTPDAPEASDAAAKYVYLYKPTYSLRGVWQRFLRVVHLQLGIN